MPVGQLETTMSRSVFRVGTAAAAAVVAVLLAACSSSGGGGGNPGNGGGGSGSSAGGSTVKIGELCNCTGVSAGPYGVPFKDGFQLGVDDINKAGVLSGTTLSVDVQDAASEVTTAVTAYNKFVQQGTTIIVSPNDTPTAKAITPLALTSKVFYLTGAGIGNDVDNTFGLSDVITPNNTFGVAVGKSGVKNVVAIEDGDNPAFASIVGGFQSGLEANGGKVTDTIKISEKDTDFSSVITKIKSEKPEAVFIGTLSVQSGNILTQIKQSGALSGVKLLGNSAWQSADLFKTAGAATAGVEFPTYWLAGSGTDNGFTDEWKQAKGSDPVAYNAVGYQAAWLIAAAVQSIRSSGGTVNGESMVKAMLTAPSSDLVKQHGPMAGFTYQDGGAPQYPGTSVQFDASGNGTVNLLK
jgi:branched-chain amino acid transport system substrate-binding protein